MKTSDFYLKPTAKNINESMAKRFGEKLDLDSYSIEQLHKAGQLIENKIAVYKNSNFNAPLESEEYHRLTFMKDAVVAELNERAVSKAQQKAAGAALAAKRGKGEAKGASKEMKKMNTKELEKFAGTKHKGLPEKKKKKVDESMTTMRELAMHHAKAYQECYAKGMLEQAIWHKEKCEECGGMLSHGNMGECWLDHGGKREPIHAVPSTPGIGGAGGATGMMTAEATKKAKPDFLDFDKDGNKKEPMKKALKDKKPATNEAKKAKPDFLDMDKDGNKKETMKKAIKDKKKSVNESFNMIIRHFLIEGEEGKAELVMAVKDMVDKFTAWSEDIATMQATAAMEMADDIRDELGADQAEAFKQSVSPALDAAFQAVKAAREAMNSQVASMTGGVPAPMGAEPGADMGGVPAPDMSGDMPPMDDEEPAMDAGDEEPMPDTGADVGREKRESVERHRRLARILVGS